ncbi:rRNA methyltransferase, partial [Streptomyces griseoviridis]
ALALADALAPDVRDALAALLTEVPRATYPRRTPSPRPAPHPLPTPRAAPPPRAPTSPAIRVTGR